MLNLTKAASSCNVTLPALTKGIKTLEAELGTPLFHREGKKILISAFGRTMLAHFQRIADEADATKALAQSFKLLEKVPLRLGVISTIGHVGFARFLGQFERKHAGLELSVTEASIADLRDNLVAGELDVVVMTKTDDAVEMFSTQGLYTEKYVVVFPADHRLGRLDVIPLAELAGEAYVDRLACEMREMVMSVCKAKGVDLYARFRSEREDWVQAMVLAGIGFAFMPEFSVTLPGLSQRPLVEPAVERKISLMTMLGRRHSPALATFLRSSQSFAWPG
ncbi:MAG: LysR family transcriptional regulator [Paracoccaceae bacterium]